MTMINEQCPILLRIRFGDHVTNGMFDFVVFRVDPYVTPHWTDEVPGAKRSGSGYKCAPRSVSGIQIDH